MLDFFLFVGVDWWGVGTLELAHHTTEVLLHKAVVGLGLLGLLEGLVVHAAAFIHELGLVVPIGFRVLHGTYFSFYRLFNLLIFSFMANIFRIVSILRHTMQELRLKNFGIRNS